MTIILFFTDIKTNIMALGLKEIMSLYLISDFIFHMSVLNTSMTANYKNA